MLLLLVEVLWVAAVDVDVDVDVDAGVAGIGTGLIVILGTAGSGFDVEDLLEDIYPFIPDAGVLRCSGPGVAEMPSSH